MFGTYDFEILAFRILSIRDFSPFEILTLTNLGFLNRDFGPLEILTFRDFGVGNFDFRDFGRHRKHRLFQNFRLEIFGSITMPSSKVKTRLFFLCHRIFLVHKVQGRFSEGTALVFCAIFETFLIKFYTVYLSWDNFMEFSCICPLFFLRHIFDTALPHFMLINCVFCTKSHNLFIFIYCRFIFYSSTPTPYQN